MPIEETFMKFRFAWMIAVVLFCHAGAHAAVTILSVTGSNPASEQDVRLDANSLVAVHWTSPTTYTNVSVASKLYCTPCSGKNDAAFADAYLMRQIGPLAALADQVAYARVKVSGTRTFVPLFSGLTLVAGDYYLVIYSPAQTVSGPSGEAAVAWGGTSDANALVVTGPGSTRENMLIYSNNAGAPLINAGYPPASFFYRSPTTPSYDLNGAYNLQYQVVSTPSMFIPQIVSGGGWKTSVALVNLDQGPVTYSIKFQDDDGRALPVTLTPGGASPSGTLAAGGTYFAETAGGSTSGLLQGSAEIATSGKLGVSVGLRQAGAGGTYQEATLTGMAPASSFSFLFDNAQGRTTIALANGNGTVSLNVSLVAQGEDGTLAQGSVTLPPRGHSAFALTAVLPSLAGLRGSLKITAPSPDLAAIGLRFDPNGSFTSVPALQ